MGHRRPRVAITAGDPRGIGPEIILRALENPAIHDAAEFVIYGPAGIAGNAATVVIGEWRAGGASLEAGRLAGEAIRRATADALAGDVDAIVTAPIDKRALHEAGWHYPGHTEMLQELAGARAVGMLMSADTTFAGGSLRVIIATTHLPLRDVPSALTADLLVEQSLLAADALRMWWGIADPRIALCAFNPHASDGGLFGDEEVRIYRPAIERIRAAGTTVSDPIPADTVFTRAIRGEFDAVISPYHDVGMAAFKTASFGSGVNVTLGLPFPRTSPDHGTAIDIAGKGLANPASMIEAIRLAVRLAAARDGAGLNG